MKEYIIWPAYLDCSLSRKYGRKLSKKECIEKPLIRELYEACINLKLDCEIDEQAKYPRTWYRDQGRLKVRFEGKKLTLLRLLAQELRKLRQELHQSTFTKSK